MKFTVSVLLTLFLAFIAGLYFDWWFIAIVAFIVALLVRQSPGKSFIAGFLGIFLLWVILSWWIDMKNEHILSGRIASLLPLGGNSYLLILVTGIIGGLVAGFAALSAGFLRQPKTRPTVV